MPVDPKIPAFKQYDILLAIGGDHANMALKRGVIAPEVKLLQSLHARFGDSDAGNPVQLASGGDGLAIVDEIRMAPEKAYASLVSAYGAVQVEKLFGPKLNHTLPFELNLADYALAHRRVANDDAAFDLDRDGASGLEWSEEEVVVETPFLSLGRPATLTGGSAHVALRLSCQSPGAARLSSIVLHFDLEEAE